MKLRIIVLGFLLSLCLSHAAGLNWPTNQLLPAFSAPAPVLDCIDVSSATGPQIDLFTSLEGIVNRTQPQVACVSSGDGEGEYTWITVHNLATNLISGYNAVLKYRTNFTGLVVTDPAQPDTLNLATTIAGVKNELICDPSLLPTLTNAPYGLAVVDDLRGRFTDKYAVYGYLYTNYWPLCTHRIMAGMETNLDGLLRDYLVAVKSATVWLDPGTAKDAALLAQFVSAMPPAGGVYVGWWPSEGNGLTWIATYGIPVLASDYFRNGSVFSGVIRPINVPAIPPPPPLQNKIYVSLILSDGDNIQYDQHAMKINWENSNRGHIPIGWTVSPLAANLDPTLLNYYWSTATTNDCLVSGPSGAGYAHIELWNSANLASFARVSDSYLQQTGLRVITIWDEVTPGVAQAFATNCPSLLGLTDQSGGTYTMVNAGLRTVGLTVSYSSTISAITSGISNAAASWNGNAPLFLAAQAVAWNLTPSDLVTIIGSFDPNKYVFVRPDHLFMLYNQLYGNPVAVTEPAGRIAVGSATLTGLVNPKAANAVAWLEWGTNSSYGSKSAVTNVSGNSLMPVSAQITGLASGTIYHYRAAVSNALGAAYGVDKTFTTGGRIQVWGDGSLGQTNVPAGLTNAVGVSGGAAHVLALKNDGTVTAWGYNTFDQTNVPAGLTNVIEVAGGVQHSLALQANGTVTVWGDNSHGQTNLPAGLTNVVGIAAGGYHNLALQANGSVTAWGDNTYGQTNVPPGLSNVVGIAAGRYHSLVLKADGTVTAWGNNNYGQTNVPAGLSQVIAVAAGDYDSLALRANSAISATLFPACRWVAASLSGSNGTPVGNWADSVLGKPAIQAATASQPQLFTNALNGHNVVRFASAASQFMTVAAANSPISGATDFTIVTVFRTSTSGISGSSFFQNTGLLGAEQPNVVADWALCLNGTELGMGLGSGNNGCNGDVSLYGGTVTDGNPHIAIMVRSGSIIRLYVDGVIVAEQNSLCPGARGNYDLQVGAMTISSGFFNGDIAEIQLFNRALSAQEITSADNTLATTYGMSGVAGAPLCQWTADSLSGADGTSVNNWPDSIGGKNATQPVAASQPKIYSNVLNGHKTVRFLNAASQYLTVAAADSPISGAGSFTMVVVFKTTTPGNTSALFYQNTGLLGAEQPGVVPDWAFCLNGSQLGAGLGSGGGGCGTDYSKYGGNVTDGNPHIAMYVRAGDTITLYVDGAIVATQGSLCPDARGDYPFLIGAMTTNSYFFTGDIATIQLYNRALSAAEIASDNELLAATYGIGVAAGTIVVWGNNVNGQTNAPPSLTNILAVASGSSFNLALQTGGPVIGWGNNGNGQTNVPAGLTNVTAISAGMNFALAIGDQAPQADNTTVTGFINHDLLFALPASNPDGNPLTYRVLSLPASGTLYQASGSSRGLLISTPNTQITDPNGQVIFAPGTGDTGNPDASLSFAVNDGTYGSTPGQVSINIGYPPAPQFTGFNWNAESAGSGGFELNFNGASNATYSVWSTTNLMDWVNLGPAVENQPGQYALVDVTATNWPQRFYRLSAP